ncbi:hypothetical protein A3Q56_07576 [Intoshia linei]|uniref:Uncharacterized protein n=1 Tax=Intoshia linei TaxID=1819745 RepID=A0A177ARW2_9BILA|nr:hypothetical protein A3Q56_07576 [Intoshia linei]
MIKKSLLRGAADLLVYLTKQSENKEISKEMKIIKYLKQYMSNDIKSLILFIIYGYFTFWIDYSSTVRVPENDGQMIKNGIF